MKKTKIICFLALFIFPVFSFAEPVKVTDANAYIYYESRAEIPAPSDTLAGYMSKDYRNARDEFTKHDLLKKIGPVLSKKMSEAKSTETVLLRVRGKLGNYNFDKSAFPTGFGEGTFIPFDHGYAASFVNGNDVEFIEVPVGSARKLSEKLRSSRTAVFDIVGSIVGAEEQKVNGWSTKKMIKVKIEKLTVKLKAGTNVGTKLL